MGGKSLGLGFAGGGHFKLPGTAGFLPKFGKNKFDRKFSQDLV
jgi:hypothetical protein